MKHSTDLLQAKRHLTQYHNKLLLIFTLVLLLSAVISLCFGSYPLSFSGNDAEREMAFSVFFKLRLPRVITAIIAGGVLGITGAVCQTVFCNPLSSPDITGVASGASFGAAAAILFKGSGLVVTALAFSGGLTALLLLLILVRISEHSGGEQKGRYILSGIIISAAADAGVMILKTVADPERELAAIEFWTMGSLAAITDSKCIIMLVTSIPPTLLLLLFSKQALILSRGREKALSLGISPSLWQTILLLLSTWAVAGVVSVVGVVGFVGLIVPHIALAVINSRGAHYLPLCFIIGAILTLISDLFARTVVSGTELPISIFCVAFAFFWFVLLFCKGKVMGGNTPC